MRKGVGFADAVKAWSKKAEAQMEEAFQESCKMLAERLVSHTPKVTGFLGHSLDASLNAMPTIRPDMRPPANAGLNAGLGTYPSPLPRLNAKIEGARLGDTVHIGFQAAYAEITEYGDGGARRPHAMVRLTRQAWPEISKEAVRRAKANKR